MEDLKAFSSRFRLWGNVAAVRPSGLSSYSSTYDFVWHPSAHSRMRQASLEYKSNLANRSTAFLPGASAIRTNLAARRTSLSSFLPGIHLIPKLKAALLLCWSNLYSRGARLEEESNHGARSATRSSHANACTYVERALIPFLSLISGEKR